MASSSRLLDAVTPRRLVTLAVVALVVLLVVVGFQKTVTTNGSSESCKVAGTPIEQLAPCPGDSDLNQGRIGVVMAPGWQVDLYLDGTPIPKDELQIEGVAFAFTPGPGTATGALDPGIHTAKVVYYANLADEASGQVYSWSFTTH